MMKYFLIIFVLLCGLGVSQTYRVGQGDELSVQVLGEKDFSGAFVVRTDGTLQYPYLKKMVVEGKTTEEIQEELSDALKGGYLVDPQVTVKVTQYQSKRILILGAVARPGPYSLSQETKILDAISMAGGIAGGGKQIIVLRSENKAEKSSLNFSSAEVPMTLPADFKGTPLVVDYYKLINQGDFAQNISLIGGDVVNVPKADEIFVTGSVGKPGPLKFEDKMTILQAVTLAGGATPEGSTRSTYILRQTAKGEEKIGVRLDKILVNKAKNVYLQANDVIVIPESIF